MGVSTSPGWRGRRPAWQARRFESRPPPEWLRVPRSTLSNHWRILREAGVIHTRRVGKTRLMSLRRDDLDVRFPGLLAAVLAGSGG